MCCHQSNVIDFYVLCYASVLGKLFAEDAVQFNQLSFLNHEACGASIR